MQHEEDFDQIYEVHAEMVYNLCLNYLHHREDAEEATQDVFIKVHRKLTGFKDQSSLKTWIYRITINHCLDVLKGRKRREQMLRFQSLFGLSLEEKQPSEISHPGIQLEQKQAMEQIFRFINELPDNQKSALLLKSTEGLPVREIAEILEVSEKAVESLLSRAKATLKKKLNERKGFES